MSVIVDARGYTIGGRKYPRVTSILGCMAKPALIGWAAKRVAEFAVAHRDTWTDLPEPDAVKLLKGAPWTERDAAADRGSTIHAVIEAYLKDEPLPDMNEDELNVAIAAESFLRTLRPEPMGVEVTVYSPGGGYAGTCDLPCRINEEEWLLDWKTSGGVYPDYALQLYAYSVAERALIDGRDVPVPWGPNPKLGVVHVRPDGFTLWEVTADRAVLAETWAGLLALHRWTKVADDALEIVPVFERTDEEAAA